MAALCGLFVGNHHMADRTDVYPSQQPTDTIWLTQERNKIVAIGYLAQGILGTSTVVDGLGCIPTVPASLAVQILPGSIYQRVPLDSVSYGSLGVDTVDQIIKQGIILPVTNLTLAPPSTSGQAINYLIEAALLEQDVNPVVLSYFNAANPAIPFSGPGGSGTSQPTIRQCTLSLIAKAGVAAVAGTQLTPAPDAGYVGLWVVTVANGASALTSAQISQYVPLFPLSSPFISVKLPDIPSWVQQGTWAWAFDTGTANQIIVNMTPQPTNALPGFEIRVKKVALPSTGAMTIIINGGGPFAVVNADGSALTSTTPMSGGFLARLISDGTSLRWTNSTASSGVGSLTASSGEGITVSSTGVVSLNYPGLSTQPVIANTDLWSFFSQADTRHRVLSWAQFLAAITPKLPGRFLNLQIFTTAGSVTYTKSAGTTTAIVFAIGSGGGGGNAGPGGTTGGGAQAGWTAIALVSLTSVTTVACVVGSGGLPNSAYVAFLAGSPGGSTSFGTYAIAPGGLGGLRGYSPEISNGSGGGSNVPIGSTAGLIVIPGNAGSPGSGSDGGCGGGGMFGGGGVGGNNQNAAIGSFALGGPGSFGGGGGGADGNGAAQGGRGGDGLILVLEFS